MKMHIILCISVALISSCTEPFKEIDPAPFNETISSRNDIANAAELIELYADEDETALGSDLSIRTENLDVNSYKVTMIEQGNQDGLPFMHKVVMVAQKLNDSWTVYGIKENWKLSSNGNHVTVTAMR